MIQVTSSYNIIKRRLRAFRLVRSEQDRRVMPAKAKRIGQSNLHVELFSRCANQHRGVNAFIWGFEVLVGVNFAASDGFDAYDGFDGGSCAEQVPDQALGAINLRPDALNFFCNTRSSAISPAGVDVA